MKNRIQLYTILFAFLLVLSSGCSAGSDENCDFPAVGLPESVMNKEMRIEDLPQFYNSFKNGKGIYLHLKNLSDKTIVYPPDTQIQLFTKVEGTWKQVVNDIHGSNASNYLPTKKASPPGQVI